MIYSFSVIEKSLLERGTGTVLCMAGKSGAFDNKNMMIPIELI